MHAGVAEMEAVLAHHLRVGVWGFDDVPHSAPVWLVGPIQPTERLAVPEAPLSCSSNCQLPWLLSSPPIGGWSRLFVSFTVSIDATRHRESLSITALGCVSPHMHRDPVVSVLSPPV